MNMWTCPQCGEVCPFGPNGSADCGFELCPYAQPEGDDEDSIRAPSSGSKKHG